MTDTPAQTPRQRQDAISLAELHAAASDGNEWTARMVGNVTYIGHVQEVLDLDGGESHFVMRRPVRGRPPVLRPERVLSLSRWAERAA